MVKLVTLLLLWVMTTPVMAAFWVELKRDQVQWGQTVYGRLHYQGYQEGAEFDVSRWEALAHVELGYLQSEIDDEGRVHAEQAFKLYPRQVGELVLPGLEYAGASSESVRLQVTPAADEHGPIEVSGQLSNPEPYAFEALLFKVTVISADERMRPLLDLPQQKGVSFHALPTQTTRLADGRFEHVLGWQIRPLRAGPKTLELPPLRYRVHSRDRYRFYLPKVSLKVLALPGYIPHTVPVGRVAAQSEIVAEQWQLTLRSDGLLPEDGAEMAMALKQASGEPVRVLWSQTDSESGLQQQLQLHTALPEFLTPWHQTEIPIPVFDPHKQHLRWQTHGLPSAWRIPLWGSLVLGGGALVLVFWAGAHIKLSYTRWRRRKAALRRISDADNAYDLHQTLCQVLGVVSLSDWATTQEHVALVNETQEAVFGLEQSKSVDDLRQRWIALVADKNLMSGRHHG